MNARGRTGLVSMISLLLVGLMALFVAACGATAAAPTATPTASASPTPEALKMITLGDIEPEEPAKKVARFKPLADYLADNLAEFGMQAGEVLIARDVEEMAGFLRDGKVDIYFDSAFPSLAVQELSGSEVILRRWKSSEPTYWSTYVALRGSGIEEASDFVGKVLAFEEPHSTSGFVLPAGTLAQQGFTLREVDSFDVTPAADEIGYVFAQDEKNTFELLLRGEVAGGGVSNQDYDALTTDLKEKIISFGETVAVPRQLVNVRPGLDPALQAKVQELLAALDTTEEGRQLLEGLKKTKKFDLVPPESAASLIELKDLIDLVASN